MLDLGKLAVFISALATAPSPAALAVPPPAQQASDTLPLAMTACLIEISGSARPYSPAIYRFSGGAEDTLLLVNTNPDLSLNFSLGVVDETPLITGAGLGADVRVRLPRSGMYQLEISSSDPVEMKARATDFNIKLALRGDQNPDDC